MEQGFSRVLIVVLAVCLFYGGTRCGSETKGAKPARFDVGSSAFQEGAVIPKLYTCDGQNIATIDMGCRA